MYTPVNPSYIKVGIKEGQIIQACFGDVHVRPAKFASPNEDIFITKTCLFKYIETFISKKLKIFRSKNSDIFHTFAQNIDCGYSLEPPRRGGSNEYPQPMF